MKMTPASSSAPPNGFEGGCPLRASALELPHRALRHSGRAGEVAHGPSKGLPREKTLDRDNGSHGSHVCHSGSVSRRLFRHRRPAYHARRRVVSQSVPALPWLASLSPARHSKPHRPKTLARRTAVGAPPIAPTLRQAQCPGTPNKSCSIQFASCRTCHSEKGIAVLTSGAPEANFNHAQSHVVIAHWAWSGDIQRRHIVCCHRAGTLAVNSNAPGL
jgi:hypothetical protein